MASTNVVTFKVTRKIPELVPPAQPTPYQLKSLSDLDNIYFLQLHVPVINFYGKSWLMERKDPVGITRDAIAKALVFYYPFAGRVREYGGRKLAVECTGEGVVLVEADANFTLEMLGKNIHPPYQIELEELLFPAPVSSELTNSALLAFQVTRLRCGGFILAYRFNHTMCDGAGVSQFMCAVGELARGAATPSVPPVWDRHLLSPIPNTAVQAAKTSDEQPITPKPLDNTVHRNFFFDAADISALRRSLPPHLQSCSKFEVLVACAWRCWAIAMSPDPDEEIVFICIVDIRKKMKPPLPVGYYGNTVVPVTAVTTAEKISKNPLHYAVELVRKAKSEATHEYVEGLIMKGTQPPFPAARAYGVSMTVHLKFDHVDLGWGTPAYGGLAKAVNHSHPLRINWYIPFKDKTGHQGVMVPACLPPHAMEVFATQLHSSLTAARKTSALNKSAL